MAGTVVEVRYDGILVAREARARELGPAGAFVEMDAPLPVGTTVSIAPAGGPVISARVERVAEGPEEHGMGLRFTELTEKARGYLETGPRTPPVEAAEEAAAAVAARAAEAPTEEAEEAATQPIQVAEAADDATAAETADDAAPTETAPDATPAPNGNHDHRRRRRGRRRH